MPTFAVVVGLSIFAAMMCGCAAGHRASSTNSEGPALAWRSADTERGPVRYAVLLPAGYSHARTWPAILFLHGKGECGTDGVRPTHVGLVPAALANPDRWPFVIIIPQKPTQESAWIDHEAMVMAVLDDAGRELPIDAARIYLSGLSQGGAGTWDLAASHPELFAAIAPVCGYGDPASLAPALRAMPIWAFHGEKDDIVAPERTRAIIAAIERAGGTPSATYFPDANHNSWDAAYATPELPRWLLGHSTR